MHLRLSDLQTKVARRVVLLFILSALVPTVTLAVVVYRQVTDQLYQHALSRMDQASKASGMAVVEGLLSAQRELAHLAEELDRGLISAEAGFEGSGHSGLTGRLEAAAIQGPGESPVPITGELREVPRLGPGQRAHLRAGGTVLATLPRSDREMEVFLGLAVDPGDPGGRVVWGRADADSLWSSARVWSEGPSSVGFCVLTAAREPIHCSPRLLSRIQPPTLDTLSLGRRGSFELETSEGSLVLSYWTPFLEPRFDTPDWTILLAESEEGFLLPVSTFKVTFPLVIILSLGIVVLLSSVQIRRSLEPLAKLRRATSQIASQDFRARVEIDSNDEFEDLASSFNLMARRLGTQFHALTTIHAVDRAVLSALGQKTVASAVLNGLAELFRPCRVVLCLQEDDPDGPAWSVYHQDEEGAVLVDAEGPLPPEARELLLDSDTPYVRVLPGEDPLGSLEVPGLESEYGERLLLPIKLEGKLEAFLVVEGTGDTTYQEDERMEARQVADQIAVALSNMRLVESLEELSWGAVRALARTIDAKSPWTAGHSERVATVAVEIGRRLGLQEDELEILHRGSLLHDIGKIGIPQELLDKDDVLDPEEMSVLQSHTRLGARILEPLEAYAPVIPLVLHHHERLDGSGYPSGLSGDEIPPLARILAVADTFDALTTDRPYRVGRSPEEALELLGREAGTLFDARAVKALEGVVRDGGAEGPPSAPTDPAGDVREEKIGTEPRI